MWHPAGPRGSALVDPPAALAESDAGETVAMLDRAVGQQHRADIGDAAEHALRPERGLEAVEVDETVEQRQYRGIRPDPGTDRVDRRVEVIVFGRQQDEIVGPADPVGGRNLDRQAETAERAVDLEAVFRKRRSTPAAYQKRDVAARLGQPSAEIPADRAGAEHQNAHIHL